MSTDEESDSARDGTMPASTEGERASAGDADDAASDAAIAAIREIEQQPLGGRAPGYQALADRLRVELEQSDPHAAR